MLSGSGLHRAALCPASGALPQANNIGEEGTIGSVIHKYALVDHPKHGQAKALEMAPEAYRKQCEDMDMTGLYNLGLSSYMAEVAFAISTQTGDARELPSNGARDYGSALPAEIPGTADLVRVDGDIVHIRDLKTGWYQDLKHWQDQMTFYAVCAASAHKCERATVAVWLAPPGMRAKEIGYKELSVDDLAAAHTKIINTWHEVGFVRACIAAGETPDVTTGAHCRYCPAFTSCPAQISLAASMAGLVTKGGQLPEFTVQSAARSWENIKRMEKVLEVAKTTIKLMAENAPVDLGDGKELAAVEEEHLESAVAYDTLLQMHGKDLADLCVTSKTTKTGLIKALKRHAGNTGADSNKVILDALRAIREAGGVTIVTKVKERNVVSTAGDFEGT